MKISEIAKYTEARMVSGNPGKDRNIDKAFSSDLMSDVLTLDEENILLIAGIACAPAR